jgi:DnaJ like chaperone protein
MRPVFLRAGQSKQETFTIAVIALGAKMAKADGAVTRDEINAFKEVFKIPKGGAEKAGRIFNFAKQDAAGFELYARQLRTLFHADRELLMAILNGLFHIAVADGMLAPSEEIFLAQVAKELGFSDEEFKAIKLRNYKCANRCPFVLLETSPDASDADLKAQYRRLAAENHPDKLTAKGAAAELIEVATIKLAAINAAYEEIMATRRALQQVLH